MNPILTLRINRVIYFLLRIELPFLAVIMALNVSGQQSNLICNSPTPWVPPTFSLIETHSSPGLACWEGDVQCPGDDVPANVVNSSTSDYATGEITGVGTLQLAVTDQINDYDAGNFVGFRVSSILLEIGLFNSITISTYLDDDLVESYSAGSLLALNVNLSNDEYDLGFITSTAFDAIEITIDQSIGLGFYNIYYAIVEDFCPGPELECNIQTPMNVPLFPVTIDYSNTGASGITIGEVLNPENAISEDTADFASLVNFVSIVGSTFITVEEQLTNYPAGTFVGFDIQNLVVIGAGILNNISVTSYLNDIQQESKTGPDLLISSSFLNNSGRQTIGFVTSTSVDKIKLTVSQPAGLNLGTTRVYSAIFQEFCAGPPLECNEITNIHNPEYPVYIDGTHTGFTGVACALCNVVNAGNVIDSSLSNWAEIIVVAGVASVGNLAVKDQLTGYSAGTFAGFHIENPSLINANILTGITISTYLNGSLQESETNLGALISIGSGLLVGTGEQYVGFITTESFDEVKISLANIVGSFDIGTTRIYNAVFQEFCETNIECDSTYYLTTPEFPVYIDAQLTGVDGVACVACGIEDEQHVITADTSDFATITVVANVIGSASIAVADALYTYPAGTFAGFVIEDLGFLLEADLFESLIISTYNNGVFQESMTGGDLIDLAVIILFISPDEGRYNVGFESTLPFDEIRITVGSLVSVINQVRVYSAFVDTRASDGGSLFCVNGPTAVDDFAETDEDEPVIIDVLANDSDDESPLGNPILVDGPSHGSAVLNPDSTYTYTPNQNFVGVDTFSYAICNDDSPVLCDTALVIITVHPTLDTLTEIIETDSLLEICVSAWVEFEAPIEIITICDLPENGTGIIVDTCLQYLPDPGFNGKDTICVSVCTINDICDTVVIIVEIGAPLSVKWLTFELKQVGKTAELFWTTTNEINNAGYEIERSPDGHQYLPLQRVISNNHYTGINSYLYKDNNPLRGLNYYRIKQIDLDGKFDYSPVRSMLFNSTENNIIIWPNPSKGIMNISVRGIEKQEVSIRLIQSNGHFVFKENTVEIHENREFAIENIAPGFYILIVESPTLQHIEKIMVVK